MAGMETTHKAQAREIAALIAAGLIYWLTIYPRAKRQIRRCKRHANLIPDDTLRAQALDKLTREHLNPEAAAFFAILGPRRHRAQLVRLMVSFQIAYDYLDAANEGLASGSLRNGMQLHRALNDAVDPAATPADYYRHHPHGNDGGYLTRLVRDCQAAIRYLPSAAGMLPVLADAAERCGEAQSRNHAAPTEGNTQLIEWSRAQPQPPGYLWWEIAAAGISCLALHAMFAAAASATTLQEARSIDTAYFPSTCSISALLDSLIDYEDDVETSNPSFAGHYGHRARAAERFAAITREARTRLRMLRNPHRHAVILSGIVSFYLSAPEAQSAFAQPATIATLARMGPITSPMLLAVRTMRRN
jgi:tetraprenyl-beta-curcumene synthase